MVDTNHPPPQVIATWPKPNYVDPPNRGPGLEYTAIVFGAVGIAVISARLYSRLFITRAVGLDDLLAVLALFCCIALSALVIVGNQSYHTGRHIWDIPPTLFVPHRLNSWLSMWCFIVAATLIKVSVLLFYRRLSVKFKRLFLIATWVGIIFNVLCLIAFGIVLLVACQPVEAYWKSFNPTWAATHHYSCLQQGIAIPAATGLSVLADFYSTLLPLLLIYNLELPIRQKLALYSLFALGFVACGLGVARLWYLNKVLNQDYDFTWPLWTLWILGLAEVYLALFAASAPALKPFFRRFLVGPISSLARNTRRHQDSRESGPESFKGTWASDTTKDGPHVDIENIGIAIGEPGPGVREMGFMAAVGDDQTRHYELRASRDGKIIPMQVYKQSSIDAGLPPTSTQEWPMTASVRSSSPRWKGQQAVESHISQQQIQLGLPVERDDAWSVSRGGSVAAARKRAEAANARMVHDRGARSNSASFRRTGRDNVQGERTRLESPSDSEAASIDGGDDNDGRPGPGPWGTTSSSRERERSDSDSIHLPRMGGRDLDVERKKITLSRTPVDQFEDGRATRF